MKSKSTFVFFLFFLSITLSFAQRQAEQWYFGINAGLNFNSGSPVAVTDGAMSTPEGCSSIADDNGSLLFYTDGITVYDKLHGIMPNSGDLMGDLSTTQSALIVPQPANPQIYYIFTLPPDGGSNGFRYSVVDLALHGGLGNVTAQKNILVQNNVTEKISAVSDHTHQAFWVMVHEWGSDGFFAYRLTNAGFDTVPVISHVGSVHNTSIIQNTYGYMKFSPNGQKLALGIGYQGLLELFDFNNTTGVLSNPVSINTGDRYYGVEFSSDNSKLYATRYNNLFDQYYLDQYDISSGVASTIISSQFAISGAYGMRALQLGPDKKIYVAKAFDVYLGVINSPDSAGVLCDYQDNLVPLGGISTNGLGLPGFVQSLFNPVPAPVSAFSANDTIFCSPECITFTDLSSNQPNYWQWHFPGGIPDTSSIQNPPPICYTIPGIYNVTLITGNFGGYDSLVINSYIVVHVSPTPTVTQAGTVFTSTPATTYQWFLDSVAIPGATGQSYTAIASGHYYVVVTNESGCSGSSDVIDINLTVSNVSQRSEKSNLLQVYPVPSTNQVNVVFPAFYDSKSAVTIRTILGEVIPDLKIELEDDHARINIQDLPGGFYILTYDVNGVSSRAAFIKE